jgi:hypothetical protein
MARNNDVFSVLVLNEATTLLAADLTLDDLSPNQIGFFNEDTNVSFDILSRPAKFYIALGVDLNGNGSVDEIIRSAGQYIQTPRLQRFAYTPYSPGTSQKIKISGYKAICESVYGLRINFQNEEIMQRIGNTQFSKSFVVKTSCCEDNCECPKGDANEVTLKLYQEMMNEELFTIVPKASQNLTIVTHGTSKNYTANDVILLEDIQALITFNKTADEADKVWTYLELETTPQQIRNFCGINMNFQKLRGTKMLVSPLAGMECHTKIEEIQALTFEEGLGYNVKQLEYKAKGWKGTESPYRVSSVTGLANETHYLAEPLNKYDAFVLEYSFAAQAGFDQHYDHDLTTMIFVKNGLTNLITGIDNMLDLMVNNNAPSQ